VTELVFITGRNKRSIEDHFDKAYELETELEKRGKSAMLSVVQDILPVDATCIYIRQAEPLGLGHAVLCAKPVVQDEPFAVVLADDLIDGGGLSCLQQMVNAYNTYQASILAVEPVDPSETDRYGIVKVTPVDERVGRVEGIVEKPKPADAPSNLAVVGRYILTPRIFSLLEETERGKGGEIQLTDAIAKLLEEEPVMAYQFKGRRYDCGDKLGYLVATVEHALAHPELKESFAEYLGRYMGTRLPR
jgi:UTP--glucose-1-phosphate uridylyltransferase